MERSLLYIKDNKINIGENESSTSFIIDLKGQKENLIINIPSSKAINIMFLNLEDDLDLHFEVSDYSNVQFEILAENELKNLKISANVGYSARICGYFADFINSGCHCNVLINLNGENSSCDWHLSSLAKASFRKEFDVNAIHNNINTTS